MATAAWDLHVHVLDDRTGQVLCDIDAPSTAEALAYYLVSRGIDPSATEETVAASAGHPHRKEAFVRDEKDLNGATVQAHTVHVEGCAASYCARCQQVAR